MSRKRKTPFPEKTPEEIEAKRLDDEAWAKRKTGFAIVHVLVKMTEITCMGKVFYSSDLTDAPAVLSLDDVQAVLGNNPKATVTEPTESNGWTRIKTWFVYTEVKVPKQ